MRLLRAEDDTLIGEPVLQSADRAVDRVRKAVPWPKLHCAASSAIFCS